MIRAFTETGFLTSSRRLFRALAIILVLLTARPAWPQGKAAKPQAGFAVLAEQAEKARDADQLAEASRLYAKALRLRPTWAEGWWNLGTIRYDRNEYAGGAAAFGHLLALKPDDGMAHLMMGLCQYQVQAYDAAYANLVAARKLGIRDDPQMQKVLMYHESMLLLRKGKFESALEILHRLAAKGGGGEDIELAFGMGVLMIQPAELPQGRADREIVQHIGQAEAADSLHTHAQAKAMYRAVVDAAPTFPNIHYAFGRFLLGMQEPDEAVPQFEEEIRQHPDHVRARLQIAAVHYRSDSEAGIPFAEEAVKLAPKFPFGHYLLGSLYLDVGRNEQAVEQLQIAKSMVPGEPQFWFALAKAYTKTGKQKEAAEARATFTRLNAGAETEAGPRIYGSQQTLNWDRKSLDAATTKADQPR